MSKFVRISGLATLAAGLLAGMGASGAFAQELPPGCVRTGDPNAAAAGAVLGGIGGALFGNAISGSHQKAQGTVIGGIGGALAGAAIGGNSGQTVSCPPGYYYRSGPPPQPAAAYDEPPPPPAEQGEVWYGAPAGIHDRILFLRRRVAFLDRDGWLSPRERDHLFHRLDEISHRDEDIRRHNAGHLPPEARERVEAELDDVAGSLRWEAYRNEHPDRY